MKILAISGSYRKDGPTEQAAKALLEGAASKGAETRFIALRDKDIRFCLNCRNCTQQPGEGPGECVLEDDMAGLIRECLSSDVLVLASPINFYQATALSKKFVERLIPLGYWPWEKNAPDMRIKKMTRKAVLMTSSAAPGPMVRLFWPHAMDIWKSAARVLGAKIVKKLYYGLASVKARVEISEKHRKQAFKLGVKLAS